MSLMSLDEAVNNGQEELVRQIVTNSGTDISQQEFLQAFFTSVRKGNIGIVKLLTAYVDINAKAMDTGLSVLHVAAQNQNLFLIQFLVEHGADINIRNNDGQTPLHIAIDSEIATAIDLSDALGCHIPPCATVTALLIAKGANVNATSLDGSTPLDWAAQHKIAEQILREHGAVNRTF